MLNKLVLSFPVNEAYSDKTEIERDQIRHNYSYVMDHLCITIAQGSSDFVGRPAWNAWIAWIDLLQKTVASYVNEAFHDYKESNKLLTIFYITQTYSRIHKYSRSHIRKISMNTYT